MCPTKHCRECGGSFEAWRADRLFCSPSCRKAFHRRRAERGAILYDLWMANRYDRVAAKRFSFWTRATNAAFQWRREDRERRGGRPSWQPISIIVDATTWTMSKIVG